MCSSRVRRACGRAPVEVAGVVVHLVVLADGTGVVEGEMALELDPVGESQLAAWALGHVTHAFDGLTATFALKARQEGNT